MEIKERPCRVGWSYLSRRRFEEMRRKEMNGEDRYLGQAAAAAILISAGNEISYHKAAQVAASLPGL